MPDNKVPEPDRLQNIARMMSAPEDHIMRTYLANSDNNTEDAFRWLQHDRNIAPWNIPMRNAEHGLYSHMINEQYGPVFGKLGSALTVPGYTAVKAGVQKMPLGVQYMIDKINPYPMSKEISGATPPSMDEVKWGLAPWWQDRPQP